MVLNQRFTVACAALLLGLIGCQSLPAPSDVTYPEPGGPYKIGQTSYRLVDTTRAEPYTEEPGDVRELMVYVYTNCPAKCHLTLTALLQEPAAHP